MFQINDILDNRYQILREIGQGGTGVVYLAFHLSLQKYVVVKRIRDHFSGNLSCRNEVDVLKKLHHPNLPQVYDFVQDRDSVYTVIDYVEGYDLEQYIRSGQQYTEQQLRFWFRQLTEVLVYLHSQKPPVIHCDIKPGNIIITPEGNAVLIDFNISLDGDMSNLTGFSPPYASPEQIQLARELTMGWEITDFLDGRTDIYSLAATFYHLISGIQPTPNVIPVPLSAMGLPYTEHFMSLLDRAMSYDRDRRYASAAKLLDAVEKLRRKDKGYGLYLLCKCASLILSALLLGGGLYCTIVGLRVEKQEKYISAYTELFQEVASGNDTAAEALCFQLLNGSEYQKFLQEKPEERGQILHALGDIAYYSENYYEAAGYYRQAMDSVEQANRTLYGTYTRDAIISYAEAGDLDSAEALLAQAQYNGFTGNDLLFVQTILCSRSGDQTGCFESVEQLLSTCKDSELCARACIAAAKVADSVKTEISWLERAAAYNNSRTILRGLAAAYATVATETNNPEERQNSLQKALQYYQQLTSYAYYSYNDGINQATVQRMLGMASEAVKTLEALLLDYPGDYRVLINLAFASDEMGDTYMASTYCVQAIEAWREDTSLNKDSPSSETIQDLMELAQKLGV